MIKICKIQSLIYNNDDYYIFSGWCGEPLTLVYTGDNPPKTLKTVEYKVTGEMVKHEKYGNQLIIKDHEKVGKILISKPTETERVRGQSINDWMDEYNSTGESP